MIGGNWWSHRTHLHMKLSKRFRESRDDRHLNGWAEESTFCINTSASLILAADQPGWSLKAKWILKKVPKDSYHICIFVCIYDYKIMNLLYRYINIWYIICIYVYVDVYDFVCTYIFINVALEAACMENGPRLLQSFRIHCHQLDRHPPNASSLAQFGIPDYSLHHHILMPSNKVPSQLQSCRRCLESRLQSWEIDLVIKKNTN